MAWRSAPTAAASPRPVGDQTVKVWDAATGQETLTLKGHTGVVNGVAFSPDGRRIASASDDQTVKVWDAGTGQETLTLKGHTDAVNGVAFSPDGRRIASASSDQTVKVWDAATGQETLTLKGHTEQRQWRGVQPRRPPHRLGQRGQDGQGLGRPRQVRNLWPRQRNLDSAEVQLGLSAAGLAILPVAGNFGRPRIGDAAYPCRPRSFAAAAVKP